MNTKTTPPLAAVDQPRIVRHSLTLDEFIFNQLQVLEDFESSWRELHRKNDEIYPLEMFAGDWSEQLAFWREREEVPSECLPTDNVGRLYCWDCWFALQKDNPKLHNSGDAENCDHCGEKIEPLTAQFRQNA